MWIWKSNLKLARKNIKKELDRPTNTEGSNLYLQGKLDIIERLLDGLPIF